MTSILEEHCHHVPHVPTDPPTITSAQSTVYMPQGLSVKLNCTFDGLPVPTVVWTLPNGSVLTSSQGRFITQSTSTSTTLTISSLVGGGDTGTYMCSASNFRGVSSSTVRLNVQGELWECWFKVTCWHGNKFHPSAPPPQCLLILPPIWR